MDSNNLNNQTPQQPQQPSPFDQVAQNYGQAPQQDFGAAPNQPYGGAPTQPYGFDPNQPYGGAPVPPGNEPGKGQAIGSLVCGIISIVFWFFGWGALVGLILGIVGIILASMSKKAGFTGGIRTGGFVCSLIGIIGSALVFIACTACAAALGSAAGLSELSELGDLEGLF